MARRTEGATVISRARALAARVRTHARTIPARASSSQVPAGRMVSAREQHPAAIR
ncbi:hypothetical protein [Streptomyces sp. NPDC092295]|uniref:hypothetical protein n=1 Tax=Streptomyces sp. NPDC092295 TaxID=3366011 RepID=UPI0037FC1734